MSIDTLTSMNDLAFTWKEHGRDTYAFSVMEQCVQLRVRILGTPYSVFRCSVDGAGGR